MPFERVKIASIMAKEKFMELMPEYHEKAISSQLEDLDQETVDNINRLAPEDIATSADEIEGIIVRVLGGTTSVINTETLQRLNPEATEVVLWAMREKLGLN